MRCSTFAQRRLFLLERLQRLALTPIRETGWVGAWGEMGKQSGPDFASLTLSALSTPTLFRRTGVERGVP